MENTRGILRKRLDKLEKQFIAIEDYHRYIQDKIRAQNIYDPIIYKTLTVVDRAVLDAYLKRFSSIQDFLGAKIFPLLLNVAGISSSKMSEVLYNIEKEGIIDSLNSWIELREVRNELEHDYPEDISRALTSLKFCIDNYSKIELYYLNSREFGERYLG